MYAIRSYYGIDVPKVSAIYRFFSPNSKHLAVCACLFYCFCLELWRVCAFAWAKANAWADVSWWDALIAIESPRSDRIIESNQTQQNLLHRALICLRFCWSESKCIHWCLMMRWVDCHWITRSDRIIESNQTKHRLLLKHSHVYTHAGAKVKPNHDVSCWDELIAIESSRNNFV